MTEGARAWLRLGVGVLAVGVVVAALAVPVVLRSDWWNTTHEVAENPPPPAPLRPVPSTVDVTWTAGDLAPNGSPVLNGTVLAADEHEITGRDPRSGDVRWRYRRDNASLCGWVVLPDLVVTLFRQEQGCRDMTALDPATGERRWYRNTDLDAEVWLTAGPGVLVAASPTRINAYDPATGLDRWTYEKQNCRFDRPVAGRLGVAVVIDCQEVGPLLALHHPVTEQELWSVPIGGVDPQVVAATGRVSVLAGDGTGAFLAFHDDRGLRVGTVTAPGVAQPREDLPPGRMVGGTLLVWTGDTMIAAEAATATLRWTAEASGPAGVTTGASPEVVVPAWEAFSLRNPVTGTELDRAELTSGQVAGITQVARVADAVVTVGPAGTTVYR